MCRENSWGFCRLDGSISMKKRQKMVMLQCIHFLHATNLIEARTYSLSFYFRHEPTQCDEFNDPSSSLVAFLLSSKAGGW
jgi:DNA repair and recombination RAD54-like protein